MATPYSVKITDRLLRFDTTKDSVVATLLPFVQTPNAPYEVHKVSVGDGNTITVQVTATTTDFLLPNGDTSIVLDDASPSALIKIPAGGASPALVTIGGAGGGGGGATGPLKVSFFGGSGIVGGAYSGTLMATGGTTPYVYSISSGALPTGLTLNASTGAITGTSAAAGSFTFVGKVVDAASAPAVTPAATIVISTGVASVLYGTHAARPAAATVPDATMYVETDRSEVAYQGQAGVWHFLSGTMWGTISPDNRPTDLGLNDAGFDYRTTDEPARQFIWSGVAWVETTSTGLVQHGIHSIRPDPATVPNGALYVETDRGGVIYQNWAGIWHYLAGTMPGTLSPDARPTDLGGNDGGFQYLSVDASTVFAPRTFTWSQTEWIETTGLLYGTHAARPVANEKTPARTIYVETDRSGVIYQQQTNQWQFLAGTMWGSIAPDNRPTDLGVLDAGFTYRTTDPPARSFVWSGTAWVETTPGSEGSHQTPWLSDIDGAQHNLYNVASIAINRTGGNSVLSITSDATDAPFVQYVRGPQTWWVGPGIEANADFTFFNQTTSAVIMDVAANGNVGIGTANPSTELHVVSANNTTQVTSECTNANGYAQFRAKSGVDAFQFSVGGSGTGPYAGACYIYDENAAAARLIINPSGHVGIGTVAPQSIFHVSYAGGYPGGPVFTGSVQSCMEFSAASGAANSGFAIGRSAVGNDNQDFFIYDGVAGAFRFNITSAGKVGIGVQAPNFQLNVHNADTYVAVMITGSDPGAVGIGSYQGTGFLQAYPDSTASNVANLTLQPSAGLVGIGTTAPRATLDIIVPSQASTVSDGGAGGLRLGVSSAQAATALYFGVDDANYAWLAAIAPGAGRYPIALNPEGGSVGVGTANPLAQLSVRGVTPTSDPTGSLISTTVVSGAIDLSDSGTAVGSGGEIIFSAYGGNWRMCAIKGYAVSGSSNSQGDMVFYTRHVSTDAGLDESMRIRADGSVQINNTLTVGNLVVSGGMTLGNTTVNGQFAVHEGTNQNLYFISQSGNTGIVSLNDALNAYVPLQYVASAHYFLGGNVGIGNSGPSFPLQVNRADSQYEAALFASAGAGCMIRVMDSAGLITAFGSEQGVATIRTNNIDRMQITVDGVAAIPGGLVVGATGEGIAPGDIGLARVSTPTTGAIYFGNTGSHYIFFDGTTFNFSGLVDVNASQLSIIGNSPVLALSGQEASGKLITLQESAGIVDLDWYANAALVRFNANNGNVTMGWSGLGGNFGIQTNTPAYPLDFGTTLGNKIALYSSPFYGFGIQSGVIEYVSQAHQFLSNGITSLYISAGGFVGVGTPAPNELLSLIPYGNRLSVATANQLAIGEASNNTGYRLNLGYYNNAGNSAWTGAIQALEANGGGRLLLNPLGGSIGIGTQTPGFPLDIWTSGAVALRLVSTNTANNNCQMRFYGGNAGAELWDIGTDIANANGDRSFQFFDMLSSKVPLYLQQGTGCVGIGAIPSFPLEVAANSSANGIMLRGRPSDNWAQFFFGTKDGASITGGFALDSLEDLLIYAGGASEKMRVNATGNVGINTTTPTAILDVNGVMRCIGSLAPTTGAGVETTYSSGSGFIQSYDRGAAAYHSLLIGGNPIELFGGNVGVGLSNPSHQFQLSTDDAWKTATSTWGFPSGAGVKQNVKDLAGGLAIINRIRPIEAEYNGEHKTPKGQRVVSVIAEEIREVLPHTVTEDSDGVLGFNPHEIIFQLILAVKQLSKEVDEWKRRFN